MPYGQEGRQAVVYLLEGEDGSRHALKVFKPRYRVPSLVSLSEALRDFASLPGLRVADRLVLSSLKHAALLVQSPDLTYAALMPWIDGPTWMQVLLDKRDLTRQESLEIARSFASLLVRLEERGIAHCDLSASNIMLPILAGAEHTPASEIELVDVEQLYAPGLPKSQFVSSGSPGYAHPHVAAGLWSPSADRFAGSILLAEMLCWSEHQVRDAAWGESYFDPSELQADSARYRLLERAVRTLGGQQAVALLQRAWQAETLDACPTFGEWLVALPAMALADGLKCLGEAEPDGVQEGVAARARTAGSEGLPGESEESGQIGAELHVREAGECRWPNRASRAKGLDPLTAVDECAREPRTALSRVLNAIRSEAFHITFLATELALAAIWSGPMLIFSVPFGLVVVASCLVAAGRLPSTRRAAVWRWGIYAFTVCSILFVGTLAFGHSWVVFCVFDAVVAWVCFVVVSLLLPSRRIVLRGGLALVLPLAAAVSFGLLHVFSGQPPADRLAVPIQPVATATPSPTTLQTPSLYVGEAVQSGILSHVVKQGEDLASIASLMGVSVRDLQADNQIYGTDVPAAGRVLYAMRGGIVHTIKRGQTLKDIAATYSVTVDAIAKANDILASSTINAGARLLVPGVSSAFWDAVMALSNRRASQFIRPLQGEIASPFGWRTHPVLGIQQHHDGIDIDVPEGTAVYASAGGEVYFYGEQPGYGNVVILEHDGGFYTLYGHLKSALVTKGQYVEKGQRIALSGNTGISSGPHLHFELRNGEDPVDPTAFLP